MALDRWVSGLFFRTFLSGLFSGLFLLRVIRPLVVERYIILPFKSHDCRDIF